MTTLIMTALCRARHKQVYAARRTMPNALVFPSICGGRHMIGSA
jgi:transposase